MEIKAKYKTSEKKMLTVTNIEHSLGEIVFLYSILRSVVIQRYIYTLPKHYNSSYKQGTDNLNR